MSMLRSFFHCPVCARALEESERFYRCADGHLFDKAKKGYVNLLLGRDASQHGDSKEMALARFEIMQEGIFEPLRQEVLATLRAQLSAPRVIVDCGCGECYYTAAVAEAFDKAEVLGLDISKEALAVANRRGARVKRAVASSFDLPLDDETADAALNIFSPFAEQEYKRILKPGGVLLMVIPLEEHLWEIKQAVYEKPYRNEPRSAVIPGFHLLDERECHYQKKLNTEQLVRLFEMTPYALKTAREDSRKLQDIAALDVTFSFRIFVFKKEG